MSELVKRLRDEADLCRNETAVDIAVLLDEAADALERQWIPVGERLPEEYHSVLIWHPDVPDFVGPITAFRKGDRWAQDLSRGDDFRVSHWQPLPQPPSLKTPAKREADK